MLTPAVWCLEGPDYAVPAASPREAVLVVVDGGTVVLPDYQSAISTLIRLGSTAEHALHLANVARLQPQHQDSYVA